MKLAPAATIGVPIGALLLCSTLSQAVAAPTVLAPGSIVAGRTIGDWTGDWWAWAAGQALTSPVTDAFNDTTGANAGINQSGPVFFVAGTFGGTANRSFTVPNDRYLLIPLANVSQSQNEPPFTPQTPGSATDIRAVVDPIFQSFTDLKLIIDGIPFASPLTAHEETFDRPAGYTYVQDNILYGAAFSGPSGPAYGRGYWVMLAPLGDTTTTITFGGAGRDANGDLYFQTQTTATIAGIPEPASLALFLGALGPLALAARRRPATPA